MRRLLALLLVPITAAVVYVQRRIDAELAGFAARERLLFADSPDRLRQLVPGFELVLADIYWLRTVQYYGSESLFNAEPRYDELRTLIEITTTLDPRLELAYRYGAVFLSEGFPIGAGQPEAGKEILEKGVRANPDSWRLRWDLGAHWFFFMKNPKQAADVLRQARKHVPSAPFWLESLAARFLEGDDRSSAREIWRHQYETGEGVIRENALYNLQVLDALDIRDAYRAAIARFRAAHGRPPESLGELAQAGYVRDAAPRDPTGAPFVYDAADGRVKMARTSRLWRSKYE